MTPPGRSSHPDLVAARFAARPNRFIVEARVGHETVRAHLPDPGRLRELLLPGAELRLRPATPGAGRRTAYTVELVRATEPPRPWVSVVTTRANDLAYRLLAGGQVVGVDGGGELRREVRHGRSRFDFLLTRGARRTWIEVKSVTLVENTTGLFPDAPTSRGVRHLRELIGRIAAGDGAMVFFVAQRADARRVRPHAGIDPEFARALREAATAGVALRAAAFGLRGDGTARYVGAVPVELEGDPV